MTTNAEILKSDPTIKAFAQNWAERESDAHESWLEFAARDFGMDAATAAKALTQMIKLRCVKMDKTNRMWRVTHGSLWDKDVLTRAAELFDAKTRPVK